MRSRYAAGIVTVVGLCACDPHDAPVPGGAEAHARSLVRPDAWVSTDAALDPEASHRPDPVDCPPRPWRTEGRGIEIDTTACNYVSVSQPLLGDLHDGDTIRIGAWWNTLASVEPAMGHFAVYLGDELLWDAWVEIPGPADVRTVEIEVPHEFDAGVPVTVHVHNHGYNTWRLEQLQARSEINP